MAREWIVTEEAEGNCVVVQACLWPPLEREPEAQAIGTAQRAFVSPPGRLARFFGDTLEARVHRAIRYIQRYCDQENEARAQVAAMSRGVTGARPPSVG